MLSDGVNIFGKHSWRATGAVYLSALGIELAKISLLARWASALIVHYARIAPLRSTIFAIVLMQIGRSFTGLQLTISFSCILRLTNSPMLE